MTQSGLVTLEEKVLGRDHVVLTRNPIKRRVRQSYEFPNGSELVICGLDDAGKVLSTDFDFVYVQEITEEGTDEGTYETLTGRLRNAKMPYTQIMSDCNPTAPSHWVYQRFLRGQLRKYDSVHQENPFLWDRERNCWTPEGDRYVNITLKSMTGVRNARFYRGVWEAAEGAVYGFSSRLTTDTPPGHVLPPDWSPHPGWRSIWSIDWGLGNPTSLQVWRVDPEGRMYLVREVYKPRQLADDLGDYVRVRWLETGKEPRPHTVICDVSPQRGKEKDAEDAKLLFQKTSGLSLRIADKIERKRGIRDLQSRFDDAEDGRPRIFFKKDALDHPPDQTLLDSGKPTSTISEIPAYVYDDKLKDSDEPIDYNDHACDNMRYASKYVDKNMADTGTIVPRTTLHQQIMGRRR
jgi:phage terminase large subunit